MYWICSEYYFFFKDYEDINDYFNNINIYMIY